MLETFVCLKIVAKLNKEINFWDIVFDTTFGTQFKVFWCDFQKLKLCVKKGRF